MTVAQLGPTMVEDDSMAVSYKKLWKLLIDKDMKKKDLCAKAGISPPLPSWATTVMLAPQFY